jgi:hypothetical protein
VSITPTCKTGTPQFFYANLLLVNYAHMNSVSSLRCVDEILTWTLFSQQTGEEGWGLLLALRGHMHSGASYMHEIWAW